MKKMIKLIAPVAAALLLAGCHITQVTSEGTTDEPIWPELDDSNYGPIGDNHQVGTWPNWDNVRQVEKGMNKDQLYYLIGRPHFHAGLVAVHEWDYAFNYYDGNHEHKICQFKVLFDKDMNVGETFWKPAGCNQQYELSGDFLFDFDSATLSSEGKTVLANIASDLLATQGNQVSVTGYTDRLGSDSYNLNLSQRRADAVKQYLSQQGVAAANITATGRGEADQVKACNGVTGNALIACLKPNRRVIISASVAK